MSFVYAPQMSYQEVHSTFPRTENGRVCELRRDNHLLNVWVKDSKHTIDSLADVGNTKKDGAVQGPSDKFCSFFSGRRILFL